MASASEHRIHGRAFPPHSAHETPAVLEVVGDRVTLRDGNGAALLATDRAGAVPDRPLGETERRVALPDGAVFLTHDGAGLDAALAARGEWLSILEGARPAAIAAFVVAAILGAAALWRWGVPLVVAAAVWLTPPAVPGRMDASTLPVLDRFLFEDTALPEARRAEVAALHAEVLAHAEPPRRGIRDRLLFRDMEGVPNALALPGGTVVVTDTLVEMLADDPDALAGVLAHEVAHVREQHSLHGLYRAAGLYATVALVAGETGPILEDVLLEGNLLLSLAGTRAMEREADAEAVAVLDAMGRDPEGLARFFDRLAAEHGAGGGWLSTHPGSAERAEAIRDR